MRARTSDEHDRPELLRATQAKSRFALHPRGKTSPEVGGRMSVATAVLRRRKSDAEAGFIRADLPFYQGGKAAPASEKATCRDGR
jgi:hypothetical protein